MITKNPGANKYTQLFKDAYNVLTDNTVRNILAGDPYNTTVQLEDYTIENQTITSLEEYFMYIGYLAQIHDYTVQEAKKGSMLNWNEKCSRYAKYLMLPINEDYFKVNLDTRAISVPSIFSTHGVGLIGDHRAETLIFEVDRYFDYIDLARTTIYVQWKIGKEDDATLLSLIDYDDQKMRLGWTLSERATAGSNITFSLRFFMRDSLEPEKIIYSLNTLPVSVKIRDALQINVNDSYTDEDPYLFTEAIKNGSDSNIEISPEAPTFGTLSPHTGDVYLDSDNTLKFTVAAQVSDGGVVSYSWEYRPLNGNAAVALASTTSNATYGLETNVDGIGAHCIITDTDKQITGQYFAIAKNTIKRNEEISTSNAWIVRGPTTLVYNKDLNEKNNFLEVTYTAVPDGSDRVADKEYYVYDDEAYVLAEAGETFEDGVQYFEKTMRKTLEVTVEVDEHAVPTYQWYSKNTLGGEMAPIPGATSSTYTATEPGWYQVKTTSTLNRDTKDGDSIEAKVTNNPLAPIVNYIDTNPEDGLHYVSRIGEANSEQVLIVNVQQVEDKLLSEDITYQWVRIVGDVDGTLENIDGDNLPNDVISVSGPVLTAKVVHATTAFKCIVTNHLNGAKASSESDVYVLTKKI